MKTKVVKINKKNEPESLKVLISSIIDDPNKVYYFPDSEDRKKNAALIIQRMSQALSKFDEKYALIEQSKVVAVAMWVPPGKHISYGQLIKVGLLTLPFRIGLKNFFKIVSSIGIHDKLSEEVTGGRHHWNLMYIGVDPNHQRKGFGSMLLEPILNLADKEKVPVFLQNFTVENTNFYQKNGFTVAKFHDFGNGFLMRNMIREPR